MTNESYEVHHARMKQAFDAVCNNSDWRAQIDRFLPLHIIEKVGGIDTIREAIIYFTATVPRLTFWASREGEGFQIEADGYWKGPAGG